MNRLQMLMRIKRSNGGYVAILLAICVPVLLFGVKHAIDTISLHRSMLTKSSSKLYKKCAREAALEVAKKWDSGLTLKQQKESMLRIADEVYNRSPTYHDSVVGNSIPGLDIVDIKAERSGKMYNPLGVKSTVNTATNSRVVEYKQVAYNKQRIKFNHTNDKSTDNTSLLEPYRRLYFLIKKPYAILEDPCWGFVSYTNSVGANQNTYSFSEFYVGADQSSNIAMNYVASIGVSSVGGFYTARVSENDDKVQLSIDRDKIKVRTDDDIGYAIPAECNVDIILSIPTNGAACNKDNSDLLSTIAGSPTVVTADTVGINDSATLAARSDIQDMRSTPIYQVAQAYRRFLHDNFKYTRGVNVGVIPYSGKLSIPPDRDNAWSEFIPKFVSTYFLSDQNTYQAYIRGGVLYSTPGTKGSSLTAGYSNWGGYNAPEISGGYGIMCRGKTTAESRYGKNEMCVGDLLSTTNPTSYKFRRVNYNPCYLGHANFLNMKCDSDCTKYYHNPYFVTELMSDVEKVYDLLNAIVPINDPKNVSNFVFLPITWANNLFQSWTNDPKKDAENTSGSTAGGQLSHQSKNTSGRKKALILLVNKPDYFEHGELTYLGFNNDFSEIPLIESDCIRFDIDYSDTTRKFADGTQYNGTIQGAKKILKFETTSGTVTKNTGSGYYESSGSAAGKLSFPQKYLMKIVVEPTMGWENVAILAYPKNPSTHRSGGGSIHSLSYINDKFFAICEAGYILTSVDGKKWTDYTSELVKLRGSTDWNYIWTQICYNSGRYIISGCRGYISASNDGQIWGAPESTLTPLFNKGSDIRGVCNIDGTIVMATRYGSLSTTRNGVTWSSPVTVLDSLYASGGEIWSLCAGNRKIIACAEKGYISISNDIGNTWSSSNPALVPLYRSSGYGYVRAIGYGNGKFLAMNNTGYFSMSSDGETWSAPAKAIDKNNIECLVYGNNQFVVLSGDGYVYTENQKGQLQFTNINPSSNGGVTSNAYEVTDKQEFYIEPSQISDSKDSDGNYYINFNMKNIRLISAEIINRPYKKIAPTCSLSGTTSGTGTAYIISNVKKPLSLKAKIIKTGSITFENINNTNVANAICDGKIVTSGSSIDITEVTTFKFPISCFSNNYKDQKIKYLLNNVNIIEVTLTDRCIRFNDASGGNRTDGAAITENCRYQPYINGADNPNPYIVCVPLTNLVLVDGVAGGSYKGDCQNCICRFYGDGRIGETVLQWRFKAGQGQRIILTATDKQGEFVETNFFAGWKNQGQCSSGPPSNVTMGNFWSSSTTPYFYISCFADRWSCCTTGYGSLSFNYFNFYYSDQYSLNNGITVENGNICFNCCGNFCMTVEPSVSIGKIIYNRTETDSVEREIPNSEYEAISITPEEYYYEPQPNGTYRITLKLNNVQVIDPQLVDQTPSVEYLPLRLPEMSRTVDFSKNIGGKPVYDINLISYGENESGNFSGNGGVTGLEYDSNLNYWVTCKSDSQWANEVISGWHHCYPRGIIGDFFINVEDIGTAPPALFLYETGYSLSDDSSNARYRSGNVLHFTPFKYFIENTLMRFTIYNVGIGAKYKAIMLGFTLPINTALYYGMLSEAIYNFAWQSDTSGKVITYDASEALKKVTTSACEKLKKDWGNNLRIYIVKYRKQNQYKHPVLGSKVNFSYGYLDDCASGRDYIYDVSDENGLKSTLEIIANDIKTFAGYYDAKNVN